MHHQHQTLHKRDLAGNYTGSGAQSRRECRNLPACEDLCLSPKLGPDRGVQGGVSDPWHTLAPLGTLLPEHRTGTELVGITVLQE